MSEHPSREELRAWLAGAPLASLDHLETCDECLDVLDEVSRLDPVVKGMLAAVTRPQPGFIDRLQASIDKRRRDAEAWGAFADLFSLSWRTPEVMWPDDG